MERYCEYDSFLELKKYLHELPNQIIGVAAAVCETGEPYVEFQESALARPNDVEVIERKVAARMSRKLFDYIGKRSGRIYWRIPFEFDIAPTDVVVRYDENGPDKDAITDRKCVMDRNWRNVTAYCRLYRATMVAPEPIQTTAIAA